MSKINESTLKSLIENELNMLLIKEAEIDNANDTEFIDNTEKFLDAEMKKTQNDTLGKTKLKAIPTLNPAERTVADKGIQINKERLKQLTDLKKTMEDKKKEIIQKSKDAQIKATAGIKASTQIGTTGAVTGTGTGNIGTVTEQEVPAPSPIQRRPGGRRRSRVGT